MAESENFLRLRRRMFVPDEWAGEIQARSLAFGLLNMANNCALAFCIA